MSGLQPDELRDLDDRSSHGSLKEYTTDYLKERLETLTADQQHHVADQLIAYWEGRINLYHTNVDDGTQSEAEPSLICSQNDDGTYTIYWRGEDQIFAASLPHYRESSSSDRPLIRDIMRTLIEFKVAENDSGDPTNAGDEVIKQLTVAILMATEESYFDTIQMLGMEAPVRYTREVVEGYVDVALRLESHAITDMIELCVEHPEQIPEAFGIIEDAGQDSWLMPRELRD